MAARQFGWLHAYPKVTNADGTVRVDEGNRASRYKGQSLPMPELTWHGNALVSLLFEVGPTLFTAMGEVPLTWQELDAYSRMTGLKCEAWEAVLLIQMSMEYMEGREIGENPLGKMPMDAV